jgi:hypothetical protein
VRLALKVAIKDEGDFVDVILLYLRHVVENISVSCRLTVMLRKHEDICLCGAKFIIFVGNKRLGERFGWLSNGDDGECGLYKDGRRA